MGRTIAFLLCQQGILLKPVLYMSHYFKQNRQEYYAQLQSVRERGTWEDWLMFFLKGVVEVSGQATATARRILALRETHRMAITANFGRAAGNGYRVLEHLYEHPILSVKDVQDLIGTTIRPPMTCLEVCRQRHPPGNHRSGPQSQVHVPPLHRPVSR